MRHAPAKLWCVAAFILERHSGGIAQEQIIAELDGIARLHAKFMLANPVMTEIVNGVFYRLFEIKRPRSWPKADCAVWATLPAQIRERITTREQQRDVELRRMQNDHADKLKSLKSEAAVPAETEKVN